MDHVSGINIRRKLTSSSPQQPQIAQDPKSEVSLAPIPAPSANRPITPKYSLAACRSWRFFVCRQAYRASVPLRILPMHMVLAKGRPFNFRKVCTCIAQAKEVMALARGFMRSGIKPTRSRRRISMHMVSWRQCKSARSSGQGCRSVHVRIPFRVRSSCKHPAVPRTW